MSNRVKRSQQSRVMQRQQQAAAVQSAQRWGTWAAGAAGVVILVVIALFVFGGDGGDDTNGEGISFNGVGLPALGDGPDPAVGVKAPLFVTTELATGEQVVVGGGGGPNDTAKVILFAAHWCPVCQEEIPIVADWLNTNDLPDGVEVVAVSTFPDATRANHPPADWFSGADWPYPVMADDANGSILAMFGMTRVPSWVVIDDQNFVIARVVGALDATGLDALVGLAAAG